MKPKKDAPSSDSSSDKLEEEKTWIDHPDNVKKLYHGVWVAAILLILSGFVFHPHGHFAWEEWFSFYAFYGFIAYCALVLTAKALRPILMRKEDYYD